MLLGVVRNFLWFFFEFFSIRELSSTLFSPWHRDVSRKYWRGFDPVRWTRLVAENLVSRVIGAIVRLCVIFFGLLLCLVMATFAVLFLGIWILFPVVVVVSIFLGSAQGEILYGLLGVVSICVGIVSFFHHKKMRNDAVPSHAEEFFKRKWFCRVLHRVGIDISESALQTFRSSVEIGELLEEHSVSETDFQQALAWEQMLERDRAHRVAFWRVENLRRIRPLARQWRFGFTPHIDQYGFDILSLKGFEEIRICAHPEELESMKMTLFRPSQNSILLVAPPGTGRKSLIQFLAKQVLDRSTDVFSSGERLIALDLDRIISSNQDADSAREFIEQVFSEAVFAGNITLVIEDIDRYFAEEKTGLVSILGKYLPLSGFRMIATTSGQGFHTSIERNEGILENLEVIELAILDEKKALLVLLDAFDNVERKRVLFTLGALRNIVRYSSRFHPLVPLPERALDMAKEALVYWQQHPKEAFITEKTIDAFVSLKTGVPLGEIQISEKEKLARLEAILTKRVIGQPEAVRQVARSLKRFRAGINGSTRAIGSFLFLGPTGVGKTELAKELSRAYFGKAGSLVRLDMSEFQAIHSLDRLIGSRELNLPGYLATLVRDTPYGVLLLDELEKAEKGILDLFLQILDEGFFTDAFGQKVVFTQMIIIATSNAGAEIIRKRFQEGGAVESVQKEIIEYFSDKNIFRVEFLNRFDGIVLFRPIEGKNLIEVARILLGELSDSVKENRGIVVEFGEGVPEEVAQMGYDPVFGARSIKRYIADVMESRIVDSLLQRNVSSGDRVRVEAQGKKE